MPPPRGRLTVDGDEFALSVLRAELPGAALADRWARGDFAAAVTVDRWRGNDFLKRLPFVEAHVTPGGGLGAVRDPARMIQHRSVVELAVETWAADARQASDLADAVTAAFHRVHRAQDEHAGGYLHRLEVPLSPGEVRSGTQLGGVVHYGAAYVLTLRPAR